MEASSTFVPALIVVDMQEDFCAPKGSLGVAGGRELSPVINELLRLPFALKVATRDFHPLGHISFSTSHPPPNNKPFESKITITNPSNPSQTKDTPLWPVHCVQGTQGAEIIPEIDISKIDVVVEKGLNKGVEMFSGFSDMFGNKTNAASLDLSVLLKEKRISHVYTVGLAGDYCVKYTAITASEEGFETYVVEEGTKCVDQSTQGWRTTVEDLGESGVSLVSMLGKEVERVKGLVSAQ